MAQKTKKNPFAPWIKLNNIPKHIYSGSVASFNTDEFVLATRTAFSRSNLNDANEKVPGIYKYNLDCQYWKEFVPYPDKFDIGNHKIILQDFDSQNCKKLYLYGNMDGTQSIVSVNMQTKEFIKTANAESTTYTDICACIATDDNGYIHIIGGWASNKHIIFNNRDKSFTQIYKFPEFQRIYGPFALHIPSKKSILLIGGETGTGNDVDIRIYCLETTQWKTLPNIQFGYYHIRAILTRDEKHVIIIALYDSLDIKCDKIFILDLMDNDKYALRISNIILPPLCDSAESPDITRSHRIAQTGKNNELLVFAYINQLFKTNYFIVTDMQMPSNDIIRLIALFYTQEMVHILRFWKEENEHFIIPLHEILG